MTAMPHETVEAGRVDKSARETLYQAARFSDQEYSSLVG
jgi:hypothetical protein